MYAVKTPYIRGLPLFFSQNVCGYYYCGEYRGGQSVTMEPTTIQAQNFVPLWTVSRTDYTRLLLLSWYINRLVVIPIGVKRVFIGFRFRPQYRPHSLSLEARRLRQPRKDQTQQLFVHYLATPDLATTRLSHFSTLCGYGYLQDFSTIRGFYTVCQLYPCI